MRLTTSSFESGGPIPSEFALAAMHPAQHVALRGNRSPQLAWSELPAGTKSLALTCHDSDLPTKADDVTQGGRVVPADLPRLDFYHWVAVDLPADGGPIMEGEFSDGVTAKGKAGPTGPRGCRKGLNSYTQWFEGDPDMGANYFGYDGPCPPWNDSRVHHYHFTLYALDVEKCPVEGVFDGPAVLAAIEGHTLGQASVGATYTLNPDL